MEFESFSEGILLYIGLEEGETAPVDTLLAIIGDKGEDISALLEGAKEPGDKENKKDPEDKEVQKPGDEVADRESVPDDKDSDDEDSDDDGEIPEGVQVINMPRLSDTMEEGTVAKWIKQEGDTVEEGDILAEIETDKATMEFESFYNGILLKIGLQEGESAKVDTLLAIIGPEGTDISKIGTKTGASKESPVLDKKPSEEKPKEVENSEESKTSETHSDKRIFASPLAKKMAEDKGIKLADLKGSGENGRIVKKDVETFKPSEKAKSPSAPEEVKAEAKVVQPYVAVGEEEFEEVKNSQMRKTIAKRLGESKFTAPHYYLTIEVNMEGAIASRKQINELPDVKVSYNDLVIKASAMALRKHPRVNSQWTGETTKIAKHIHMGVAVAVEDGLLVPVLRFADQMSMTQIGAQVKDLAGKARNKKLQPQEMEGSTFTVSNLGMFGISEFTSIINQPNSAILSVGAIVEKPVVKDAHIVVGNTMKLTLACDHRTVDGATGSAFLQTLKSYLENPVTMLA
jgi:pyruvate dehydrogenase E2 component (dihydrolipoamide acetyltransferase)